MTKQSDYSAEDIENMRTILKVLYLSDELNKQLSVYELHDIAEKMLQTYISQGLTYDDLSKIQLARTSNDINKPY